jgi:two-component system nitrate/nitrite response regulator NarL
MAGLQTSWKPADEKETLRGQGTRLFAAATQPLGDEGLHSMIRVLVVAGVRFYRDGIAAALSADPRFGVVGGAADVPEAATAFASLAPDVVLLDLAGADGPGHVRALLARAPAARIVALGVQEAEDDVLPLAEAGVAGYVTRDGSVDDLLATVESVAAGETICSPRITATLLRRVALLARDRHAQESNPERDLTSRERQIVALIDEGLSNKEIATRLRIELATVKNHVHNILEKLRVHRRGEAAAAVRGRPLI